MPPISTERPVLILSDLREVEDIVTKRTSEIDCANIMHTWFGLVAPKASIGLKSKTEAYRKQRSLWNVMLNPPFLKDVVSQNIHAVALEVIDLWTQKTEQSDGMAFDARDDVQMAMLESTWRNMFGLLLNLILIKLEAVRRSRQNVARQKVVATFEAASMPDLCGVLDTFIMCLDWVIQGVTPRGYTWLFWITGILTRAERKRDELLDEQICAARVRFQQRHPDDKPIARGAIDLVLEKDARTFEVTPATNEALQDEALELLLTGRSTTSGSFLWVLKYLMDNLDAQYKLHEQLSTAFGHRNTTECPSAESIVTASLPYLDAVLAETLRCSATVPVCFRETIRPCTILGHDVPAGTPLILLTAGSSYKSLKMPTVLEELRSRTSQKSLTSRISTARDNSLRYTDAFNPDRWLVNGDFNADAVCMLPFSAGPRGCFGKKIAMLKMRIFIVVLMMHFELPTLAKQLSGYGAVDGLSRKPRQCYVSPRPLRQRRENNCGRFPDV